MSWRHFVPPIFVAALVVLGVAGLLAPQAGLLLALLVAAYGGTILAISAANALSKGVAAWLATAAAFMIIHLAWGTGFLVGLARFAHWWRRSEPAPPSLAPSSARNVSQEKAGLAVSEAVGRTV
jgi:hypothetical protein